MNAPINERVTMADKKAKEVSDPVLVPAHKRDLLNLLRLHGRLNPRETAVFLNCATHDIPILVAKGLLVPLGHPEPGAMKFFWPVEVLELAGDREKLGQICDALYEHWRSKNAAKASATRKARALTIRMQADPHDAAPLERLGKTRRPVGRSASGQLREQRPARRQPL